MERSALRLGQIAGDVLDSTRIELGRIVLDREPVDAASVAEATLARHRVDLGRHPVALRVEGRPPPVRADPARLEQILAALLDNAAKFSADDAPIDLLVRAHAGGTVISVHDRGVGIAKDDLARLFDRVYQSRRARDHKTGLGLGLYIVKGLVDAHEGRLSVDSEPGRGSRFDVWLPAAEPTAQPSPPEARE
jgi:signal transduction histidine kinase